MLFVCIIETLREFTRGLNLFCTYSIHILRTLVLICFILYILIIFNKSLFFIDHYQEFLSTKRKISSNFSQGVYEIKPSNINQRNFFLSSKIPINTPWFK